MTNLSLPDEMSERLTKRADALHLTVEQLVAQLLEDALESPAEPVVPSQAKESFDEWKKKFDTWMMEVQARAGRYPPGFVSDDSRESIYEGCGQ